MPPNPDRRRGDRRTEKRHPITIAVAVSTGNELSIHASKNLSRGGAFFENAIPYRKGTPVEVRFELPGDPHTVVCEGVVVNVPRAGFGMGVKFSKIDPDDARRIDRFADTHKNKKG